MVRNKSSQKNEKPEQKGEAKDKALKIGESGVDNVS